MVLPDRGEVTMTVPFMRAYTELLAATCHRRGAHAMGGMSALIPSRKGDQDGERRRRSTACAPTRSARSARATTAPGWRTPTSCRWRARCSNGTRRQPNQLERQRDDVQVTAAELLDLAATPGGSPRRGCAPTSTSGFQYISFWLHGRGAAAINSLMEDAATAEISRSQIWQWIHHGVQLEDGQTVTPELVRQVLDEETAKIREAVGDEIWQAGRPGRDARDLRARGAVARAGRVPDDPGVRVPGLGISSRHPAAPPGPRCARRPSDVARRAR